MKTVKIRFYVEAFSLGILVFYLFAELTDIYYFLILVRTKDAEQVMTFVQQLSFRSPYIFRVIKAYLDSSYSGVEGVRAALIGISFPDWLVFIYLVVLFLAKDVAKVYKENLKQLSAVTCMMVGVNLILLIGVYIVAFATNFTTILKSLHMMAYVALFLYGLLFIMTNMLLVKRWSFILSKHNRQRSA